LDLNTFYLSFDGLLREWGHCMSPNLRDEVLTGWPEVPPGHWRSWSAEPERLQAVLQFRHEMLKELAE
jgi:hypothetical protein